MLIGIPATSGMALLTVITGPWMVVRFAACNPVVMALGATCGNATVINTDIAPVVGSMTHITFIIGNNMIAWFTHSRGAIMTRGTVANDIGMINPYYG